MQTEKQRERLVELIKNADSYENLWSYDLYDLVHDTGGAEEFADYLLANNVVVLPCNIGDTVYYINQYSDIYLHKNFIYEAKVARMVITKNNEIALVIHIKDEHGLTEFPNVKDFGKTVFLSKAEAENVLKERNNDD